MEYIHKRSFTRVKHSGHPRSPRKRRFLEGNYTAVLEDAQRDTPVFGSKYWFGRGATYFVNAYLRF